MASLDNIFFTKFNEFARDLHGACPELAAKIQQAVSLSADERKKQFKEQVLPHCAPSRDNAVAPAYVLPGVPMPKALWEQLSTTSQKSIQEYLTILSFTFLMDTNKAADVSGSEFTSDWAKKMMDEMKSKMNGVDFASLSAKIAKIFSGLGASSTGGIGGIPSLPEKFMKGQIAKLAEEIVKEFRMEDFGLNPAEFESAGNDPTKALNMIMEMFMKNPQAMQGTIQKLTKKLQQKIQTGSLRPQELVAEAEELMKTFSENPEFVELMESFRQMFGFENAEMARAAGQDGNSRMAIARARLRAKLEKRKGGKK
jgi:hypothetical protein